MAEFKYTALDRAGKQVTGNLVGRDVGDAAVKVRALGYFPVDISTSNGGSATARKVMGISDNKTRPIFEGHAKAGGDEIPVSGKKVGRIHILLFTRELADLIDAGLPIDRALSVLIQQSDSDSLQAMVTKMQGDVRAGKPLSDAMRAFP